MSSSIKEYGQVVTNFLNEVAVYNKIEKAEENSNNRINQFQKFILQNQSLLANFTGVEKHICYFTDTYEFEQIFDYSIIENSIPEIQHLGNKSNLLLDKVKQIISANQRHNNDKFITEIKSILQSCKDQMTLRDIQSKIKEVDKISAKADTTLKEIDTLNKLLSEINKKLQVIGSYYDRYNKQNEENKTLRLITHHKDVAQISDLVKMISDLSNQNQLLDSIISNFDKEKQHLQNVQKSLSSNVNIWKEDADYYISQINSLLPKLSISNFDMNTFLNEITQKEKEKKQEISNYENSISTVLKHYQSWINDYKTHQYSKVEFEKLKQKIAETEKRKSNSRNKKIAIIISISVAVLTVIILGIIYPEWIIPIVIIAGIIAFIIWRKVKN